MSPASKVLPIPITGIEYGSNNTYVPFANFSSSSGTTVNLAVA